MVSISIRCLQSMKGKEMKGDMTFTSLPFQFNNFNYTV